MVTLLSQDVKSALRMSHWRLVGVLSQVTEEKGLRPSTDSCEEFYAIVPAYCVPHHQAPQGLSHNEDDIIVLGYFLAGDSRPCSSSNADHGVHLREAPSRG